MSSTSNATSGNGSGGSTGERGGGGIAAGVTTRRVMDEATRLRRHRKQLETLESDNFQDTPEVLFDDATTPLGGDLNEDGVKKRRRRDAKGVHKYRPRKSYAVLLDESGLLEITDLPTYLTVTAGPSQFPGRKICAVCGFPGSYTCVTCSARYCSHKCLATHTDTRCLKWTS